MDPKTGWGRYASDLISGVKKAGHETVILKEQDDGYEGIPILAKRSGIISSSFRARKYLKDCDIIHALDGYPYGIIAALANIGLGKKIVITGVGTYAVAPLYKQPLAIFMSWAYKKADKVATISNYTKNEILKKTNINIDVINPGIDFKSFQQDHLESDQKFILGVGALKERKGYHISILAFSRARKVIPGLEYKIIGSQKDVSYFSDLKALARECGVSEYVKFITNITDKELKDLYGQSKMFILTSINASHHFEGYGLVFLEAAAAGLPVLGTSGNGIEDTINKGKNGILVPQNDIEKTAKAIVDIMSDSEGWIKMSQASYKWAEEHNLDDVVKKYTSLYGQILK